MCEVCYQMTREVALKPMRGIDRPEGAPEDWRPSLDEMMRHARIAISFNERQQRERALNAMGDLRRPGDEKYTQAQLKQMMVLRGHLAVSRPHGEAK